MHRTALKSNTLRSIGYDLTTEVLEVEFAGGSVYEYKDVPPELYEALKSALSPGTYLNKHIVDKFPTEQIE